MIFTILKIKTRLITLKSNKYIIIINIINLRSNDVSLEMLRAEYIAKTNSSFLAVYHLLLSLMKLVVLMTFQIPNF